MTNPKNICNIYFYKEAALKRKHIGRLCKEVERLADPAIPPICKIMLLKKQIHIKE